MRNDYSEHKYDRPFTGFLWEHVILNSGEDDSTGDDVSMEGVALVGRYVVTWDFQGFVSSERFSSAAAAREAFEKAAYLFHPERCPECDGIDSPTCHTCEGEV